MTEQIASAALLLRREEKLARLATLNAPEDKRVRKRLLQAVGKINKQLKALEESSRGAAAAAASGGGVSASGALTKGEKRQRHRTESKARKKLKTALYHLNVQLAQFAKQKQLDKARKCFGRAQQRGVADAVSFTNMINAHVRCADVAGALGVLDLMRHSGVKPTVATFTVLIKGHCNACDMASALDVLAAMDERRPPVRPNVRTFNALLRGCVRVGAIDCAVAVLRRLCASNARDVAPDRSSIEHVTTLLCQDLRLDDAHGLVSGERLPSVRGGAKGAEGDEELQLAAHPALRDTAGAPTAAAPEALVDASAVDARAFVDVATAAALLSEWGFARGALDAAALLCSRAESAGPAAPRAGQRMDGQRMRSVHLFESHRREEILRTIAALRTQIATACGAEESGAMERDAAERAATGGVERRRRAARALLPWFGHLLLFNREDSPSSRAQGETWPTRNVRALTRGFGLRECVSRCCAAAPAAAAASDSEVRALRAALLAHFEAAFARRSNGASAGLRGDAMQPFVVPDAAVPTALRRTPRTTGVQLKVEVGAGDGDWAIAEARADAGAGKVARANWITVEQHVQRVHRTWTQAVFAGARNLWAVAGNANAVLSDLIASGAIDNAFCNHPEPPERTGGAADSQGEHMLAPAFLRLVHSALRRPARAASASADEAKALPADGRHGGTFTIVTDSARYGVSLAKSFSELRYAGEDGQGGRLFEPVPVSSGGASAPRLHVEFDGIELYEGLPLQEFVGAPFTSAGHAAHASSYFDRLWKNGGEKSRYFVIVQRT
jgi:pentatricopeptide repeat protein